MQRHYLKISFDQKDEVKQLAYENDTAIRWDADNKKWYWDGDEGLPEFLQRYAIKDGNVAPPQQPPPAYQMPEPPDYMRELPPV